MSFKKTDSAHAVLMGADKGYLSSAFQRLLAAFVSITLLPLADVFSYHRVAGPNPVLLHRLSDVEAAVAAGFSETDLFDTLKLPHGVFGHGNVFAVDYAILADVKNGTVGAGAYCMIAVRSSILCGICGPIDVVQWHDNFGSYTTLLRASLQGNSYTRRK